MNRLQKLAGMAAAAALFVYAMSCRPAWSPDSSAVAFPFVAEQASGLAVHNIKTGETKSVFVLPEEMSEYSIQPVWRGGKILMLCHDMDVDPDQERTLVMMELDPAGEDVREIATHTIESGAASPAVPPVIGEDGTIWLGGIEEECSVIGLSPDGKSLKKVGPPRTLVLARGGERVFYAAVPDDDDEETKDLEIGVFEPGTTSFTPVWSYAAAAAEWKDLEATGAEPPGPAKEGWIKTIHPCMAAAPDGSGCAVVVGFRNDKVWLLFIRIDGEDKSGEAGGEQRPAAAARWVALSDTAAAAGGIAYAADGKTVWAAGLKETGTSPVRLRPILMQVDPDKGVLRTKDLPFAESIEFDEHATIGFQPALSPDGRWLALPTYPSEKAAGFPLALTDLRSDNLDSSIIAAPAMPAGEAPAAPGSGAKAEDAGDEDR